MSIDLNELEWRLGLIEEELEDMKESQDEVVMALKAKLESLEAKIDELRGSDNDIREIEVGPNIRAERQTTPEE